MSDKKKSKAPPEPENSAGLLSSRRDLTDRSHKASEKFYLMGTPIPAPQDPNTSKYRAINFLPNPGLKSTRQTPEPKFQLNPIKVQTPSKNLQPKLYIDTIEGVNDNSPIKFDLMDFDSKRSESKGSDNFDIKHDRILDEDLLLSPFTATQGKSQRGGPERIVGGLVDFVEDVKTSEILAGKSVQTDRSIYSNLLKYFENEGDDEKMGGKGGAKIRELVSSHGQMKLFHKGSEANSHRMRDKSSPNLNPDYKIDKNTQTSGNKSVDLKNKNPLDAAGSTDRFPIKDSDIKFFSNRKKSFAEVGTTSEIRTEEKGFTFDANIDIIITQDKFSQKLIDRAEVSLATDFLTNFEEKCVGIAIPTNSAETQKFLAEGHPQNLSDKAMMSDPITKEVKIGTLDYDFAPKTLAEFGNSMQSEFLDHKSTETPKPPQTDQEVDALPSLGHSDKNIQSSPNPAILTSDKNLSTSIEDPNFHQTDQHCQVEETHYADFTDNTRAKETQHKPTQSLPITFNDFGSNTLTKESTATWIQTNKIEYCDRHQATEQAEVQDNECQCLEIQTTDQAQATDKILMVDRWVDLGIRIKEFGGQTGEGLEFFEKGTGVGSSLRGIDGGGEGVGVAVGSSRSRLWCGMVLSAWAKAIYDGCQIRTLAVLSRVAKEVSRQRAETVAVREKKLELALVLIAKSRQMELAKSLTTFKANKCESEMAIENLK